LPLTLTQAGKATGRNRTTILRAVRAGKLSATHDAATGAWLIEAAELFRLYPPVDAHASAPLDDAHLRNGHASAELREVRARLDDAQRTIEDLRRRLDAESTERRQAQVQLAAVLADQRQTVSTPAPIPPVPRRWWEWRRRGY
jgi:hypothetical protein